jgi:saposin
MEKIESLLVNNATETEIIEVVEKICDFFPSAERSYCDKFIAEYGKLIIKALVDGVGPKVVCTLIHLCLGEEAKIAAFSFDMKIGECSVCEFVLEMVKDAVGENFTKSAVVDALDHVCGLFPSALRDECKAFVNKYGSEVVQLLDDAIDPKAICETIKLCPKTSRLAAPWQMLEKMPPY